MFEDAQLRALASCLLDHFSCQSSVNAIAPRDTRDLLPDAPVEHHGTTLSIMA